jgi:hypothetical protein
MRFTYSIKDPVGMNLTGDVMDKWRRTIISSVRLDSTSAGSFPASPASPVDTANHHAAKQGGTGERSRYCGDADEKKPAKAGFFAGNWISLPEYSRLACL